MTCNDLLYVQEAMMHLQESQLGNEQQFAAMTNKTAIVLSSIYSSANTDLQYLVNKLPTDPTKDDAEKIQSIQIKYSETSQEYQNEENTMSTVAQNGQTQVQQIAQDQQMTIQNSDDVISIMNYLSNQLQSHLD